MTAGSMADVYRWLLLPGPRTTKEIWFELHGTQHERTEVEIAAMLASMPDIVTTAGRRHWRLRQPRRDHYIPLVAMVALVEGQPQPMAVLAGWHGLRDDTLRRRVQRAAAKGWLTASDGVVSSTHAGERALRIWRRNRE